MRETGRAPGRQGDVKPIPAGWRWAKLEDVCEIEMGQSPPGASYNNTGDGKPLLNGPSEFGTRHPVAVQWTTRPSKTARTGDILYCVRASIGRKNIADQEYCIGRGLAAIRARDGRSVTSFIWHLLDNVTGALLQRSSGSTFVNLPGSELGNFRVSLPPLPEQQRIAAILDEQMAAVERARVAAAAQLAAARALPAAYLRAAFDSAEARRWPKMPLGDLAEIVSGVTLGRRVTNQQTRPVPYLRVANVKDGYLDLSDVYQIDATEEEIAKLRLRYGDLLLTEGGDPDKLGRGTFWQGQIPECIHQNHIYRLRFDEQHFSPQFISGQIGSAYGKAYFLAHAKQTTGIATINQQVLRGFPLMAPPIGAQKRVAAELKERMAVAERARQTVEQQLDAINLLPAALLRKAFQGEV